MPHEEVVDFNQQVVAVVLEHQRLLSHLLKTQFGLTYNQFSLLVALKQNRAPATVRQLSDFLVLKPKTILDILLMCEDARLVEKSTSNKDHRQIVVSLSEAGNRLTVKAQSTVLRFLREAFWGELPPREYLDTIVRYCPLTVDFLRGFTVEGFANTGTGKNAFSVAMLVLQRLFTQRWAQIIRTKAGLNIGEYRVLALLEEQGPLRPHEIARRLIIARSAVSLDKQVLLERGLVEEYDSEEDSRGVTLATTSAGRRLARGITGELKGATHALHYHIPNEQVGPINVWYIRSYSNLRSWIAHHPPQK